jgi:hypothetical protein
MCPRLAEVLAAEPGEALAAEPGEALAAEPELPLLGSE